MSVLGSSTPTGRAQWQVPAFRATVLGPARTRYCVVVFVINEGERIRAQLGRMRPLAHMADIIIADGGSTDDSLAETALRDAGVRALLVKEGPGKLSAQMRMALAFALDEGYDGIITMDGNDKDDPRAIPSFVAALDQGVDHAQGSRFIPGGLEENTPLFRRIGITVLHAPLISIAARFRYTDTTNGFRAYSRRLLTDPRVAVFRDVFSRYELHYYLAIRAARLGFRVAEIPVSRVYPRRGAAPTKISPIKGNLLILRTLAEACLHRYDPPTTDRAGEDTA